MQSGQLQRRAGEAPDRGGERILRGRRPSGGRAAVLAEAVAAGRPVVATDFPHARELLSSGAGIVVPHGDTAAMSAALHSVLTDRVLAVSMAANAHRVAADLRWPTVAAAYARAGEQLLARRVELAA